MMLKSLILYGLLLCSVADTFAQKRYADNLFLDVDSIVNIPYGKAVNIKNENETLLLDVFLPPKADKVRYRPLIIFIHGGGFVGKTKSTDLSTLICTNFARKGYVVATIDYRLGVEQPKLHKQFLEAMYRAQQDAKAAIRYFRKHSVDYGIDKSQIFVCGASAGAMTALAVAYMNVDEVPAEIDTTIWGSLEGNSGNEGYASNVQGVINCWGALPKYQWIKKGDVPLLNISGTNDKTVAYDSAFDWHGFKYGSTILHQQSLSVGNSSVWWPFYGAGHSLNGNRIKYDSAAHVMVDWLFPILNINNPQKAQSLFRQVNLADVLKPTTILSTMEKVANWQMNLWDDRGYKYHTWHWANAAGYTGFFELSKISKNKAYEQRLMTIGKDLDWNTGPSRFFADDYCIAQTYANLYFKYKDPKMLAKFQLLADSIVAQPHTESLEWKDSINYREWAWCDALFMGPTALAYLATATKQQKYLTIANKLWWQTHNYLYDTVEHLFYRDQRFFNQQEKNGKKVFWSRGNGWVLAGLARVVDNLPKDFKDRDKYISLYKSMVAKISTLQQPDGSWHASLLDPDSYPIKELSGTGFYVYAILWGLNSGILDKKTYWPIVEKGWATMLKEVKQNGMLGFIQPIGAAPDLVNENSTEIYGIGAFLLAGTELYKYVNKH